MHVTLWHFAHSSVFGRLLRRRGRLKLVHVHLRRSAQAVGALRWRGGSTLVRCGLLTAQRADLKRELLASSFLSSRWLKTAYTMLSPSRSTSRFTLRLLKRSERDSENTSSPSLEVEAAADTTTLPGLTVQLSPPWLGSLNCHTTSKHAVRAGAGGAGRHRSRDRTKSPLASFSVAGR